MQLCSCPPQAVVRSASSLRDADSGGAGRCSPWCQEDRLKASAGQRLKSTGYSSRFCEGTATPIGAQLFTSPKWKQRGRAPNSIVNALPPEAVSAAAAIAVVGVSAGALLWMNQDKLRAEEKCEACDGSGLCSACKGEGFQPKELSAEAVERARANARNAATRYTAGLAKKWSYCTSCSGSRNCPACDGRGKLSIT